jgi:hypothetical protein
MQDSDSDNSPAGMPKGLGNIDNPLPGNDGNEQGDAYREAQVGGSRSENISQPMHWRRMCRLPALLVDMKFHCFILFAQPYLRTARLQNSRHL